MKVSIITVNFNNLSGLKKTVQSVLTQTHGELEYIIIDGGSDDGSKQYIEEIKNDLNYYVSEPDNGIYHAMNKGIEKATGSYLLFLNSGDRLVNENTIERIFFNDLEESVIHGNIIKVKEGKTINIQKGPECRYLTKTFMYYDTINHQSSFINRKMFAKYGMYNESYKITSDWAYYLKLVLNNESFLYINVDVAYFEIGGAASQNPELIDREKTIEVEKLLGKTDLNDYQKVRSLMKSQKLASEYNLLRSNRVLWGCIRVLMKLFRVKL